MTRAVPRKEKLLKHVPVDSGQGLEFGPLDKPILTKSEAQIFYLDYASLEELRALYKNEESVQTDKICAPDFICGDSSFSKKMNGKTFDYVLASHVFEHVPDMISWLEEIAKVLNEEGVVSLALPDKRATFDRYRSVTQLADAIDAYLRKETRPTPRQIFDQLAWETPTNGYEIWKREPPPKRDFLIAMQNGFLRAKRAQDSGEYHNVHCWVFTPQSFLKLFAQLSLLNLVSFKVLDFYPTGSGEAEFFVTLKKMPEQISREEKIGEMTKALSQWLELKSLEHPPLDGMVSHLRFKDRAKFFGERIIRKLSL